jgi:hypothetical protein
MQKLLIIALALCVSIIMVQPLMAGEPDTALNTATRVGSENGEASEQITPRFYTGYPSVIYYATSGGYANRTYCLMGNIWFGTSNARLGNMMIEAVGSRRKMGFNVYSWDGYWDFANLWNY